MGGLLSGAVAHLELKIGAQVILLKNIDIGRSLVNGARGVVIGFEYSEESPGWGQLPKVAFTTGSGRRHTTVVDPQEWSLDMGKTRLASRLQVNSCCC